MPRIPQGEFDQTPSSRVGSVQTRQAADPMDNFGKAIAGAAGAFAQLADQQERTEAYSQANKLRQEYNKQKATYMEALQNSNGSGMASFFDPNDKEMDLSKRKRIQKPIAEMYKELEEGFVEGQKKLGTLTRGDIAQDLAQQYVGDDLIQTQIQTSKYLTRKREAEMETSFTDNVNVNLEAFNQLVTDVATTPDQINLGVSFLNNRIQREMGVVSPVLGEEKMKDATKYLDRALAASAKQILSSGVNNNTVFAADALVKRIKDPAVRSLADTQLENVRKSTAEVKTQTTINTTKDMTSVVATKAIIDSNDVASVTKTFRDTINAFVDPKYTTIKKEDLNKAGVGLMSTMISKKIAQEIADSGESLDFLYDPNKDFIQAKDQGEGIKDPGAEGQWNVAFRGNRGISGAGNPGDDIPTTERGIRAAEGFDAFIKKHEGYTSVAIRDAKTKQYMIGAGLKTMDPNMKITPELAEEMFQKRLKQAEDWLTKEVNPEIQAKLTQGQKNVLIDMHYNLTANGIKKVVEHVNNGTLDEAKIKEYVKSFNEDTQEYETLGGLVKRAEERAEMWGSRGPANQANEGAVSTHSAKLMKRIEDELKASNVDKMAGSKDLFEQIKQDAFRKIKTNHENLKHNVADLVETKYPDLVGREKFEKMHQIARDQGYGDPKLVSDKYQSAWNKKFDDTLMKNTNDALTMFNQELSQAGNAKDGDSSYRRALAMDLAGKDPNKAWIIAAADAPVGLQAKMFENAAAYKQLMKEDNTKEPKLIQAFKNVKDFDGLEGVNSTVYLGMRQAVLHRAAALIHGKETGDEASAVKMAAEEFRGMYASTQNRYGSILGLNVEGKTNYSGKMKTVELGMERAAGLAHLPREVKLHILSKTDAAKSINQFTPDSDLEMYLNHMVDIKPDGRYPNMHKLSINGAPLLDADRNELKVSMDQILEYGTQAQKKQLHREHLGGGR